MKSRMALTVRNDTNELVRLNEFLGSFWAENQLPEELVLDVTLALEEMFLNVVQHAYLDTGEHDIWVGLALERGHVSLTIEDDGVPFNPMETAPPDTNAPIEQREIGGLGIHLVQSVMDGIEYSREDERNRLVMKKRIAAAG